MAENRTTTFDGFSSVYRAQRRSRSLRWLLEKSRSTRHLVQYSGNSLTRCEGEHPFEPANPGAINLPFDLTSSSPSDLSENHIRNYHHHAAIASITGSSVWAVSVMSYSTRGGISLN